MAELDRATFIVLLDRLGATNDDTALKAARELHQSVADAGITWDDLLRPESGESEPFPGGADAEPSHSQERMDDRPSDDEPSDDEPTEDRAEPAAAADEKVSAADRAEAARLIERMLARKTLSKTARQDLAEMKRTIADGSIDAMDCNYIRALAKRLGI